MLLYLSTIVDKNPYSVYYSVQYNNHNILRKPLQAFGTTLFIRHPYHRHYHLFQTYPAVLESVLIIIYKMVVIIRVT
jgi:hypothetical protein